MDSKALQKPKAQTGDQPECAGRAPGERAERRAVVLRDMIESDIGDYVRWFTEETEWMNWDAPWENEETSEEEERRSWSEYYASVRELPPDAVRWKFEIELDGRHIGWVCRYFDLDYMENQDRIPAVGIDIPEPGLRGQGAGTEALRQFIDYLRAHGFSRVYTQTWSGNKAMLCTAEKLGFKVVCRRIGLRTVRGEKFDALTLELEP